MERRDQSDEESRTMWKRRSTTPPGHPSTPADGASSSLTAAGRELYHQLNFIADIAASSRAVGDLLRAVQSDALDDAFAGVASQLLTTAQDVAEGCSESHDTCEVVESHLKTSVAALQHINGAVESLTEASHRIDGIVEAIVSFARQTEMLSINAQIEAARAGEAGKGFAVVAAEVNGLADRIGAESAQIRSAVDAMQAQCGDVRTLVQREVELNDELLHAVERMRTVNDALSASGSHLPESVGQLDQFLEPLSEARDAAEHNAMIQVAASNVSRNLQSIHGALRRVVPAASTRMNSESFVDAFARVLIEGRETPVEPMLDQLLASGVAPAEALDAVGKAVQAANMVQKREHTSVGDYYLNFLAVEAAINHLQPQMPTMPSTGMSVVIGNARGDYHSLGREMVGTFLRASGIEVIDVGLGAEPRAFVDAVRSSGARVVGVSSLLVESAKQIRVIRRDLNAAGFSSTKIVAGGACFVVDRELYHEVEADYAATAASDMVNLVHEIYGHRPLNEIVSAPTKGRAA